MDTRERLVGGGAYREGLLKTGGSGDGDRGVVTSEGVSGMVGGVCDSISATSCGMVGDVCSGVGDSSRSSEDTGGRRSIAGLRGSRSTSSRRRSSFTGFF